MEACTGKWLWPFPNFNILILTKGFRLYMKKYAKGIFISLLFLLAACGAKDEEGGSAAYWGIAPGMDDLTAVTERTEYYDIIVEAETLFEHKQIGAQGSFPIGVQFYTGEPVQLWADASSGKYDIYLYRKDMGKELLLEGVSGEYVKAPLRGSEFRYPWYLDTNGDFYCCHEFYLREGEDDIIQSTIAKISSDGEILYQNALEKGIQGRDFCQTEDGRMYLLYVVEESWVYNLAELDPATGEMLSNSGTEVPYNRMDVYLGSAGDLPAVAGFSEEDFSYRILKVDTKEGSLLPIRFFTGTSYGWQDSMDLQDIQVREDGQTEFLWTDGSSRDCLWERLKMEKVEKIPIILRTRNKETWLSHRIAEFNQENDIYHVVVENCGHGNDLEDFARLTSIQIGAGKGPDIVCGDLFSEEYLIGMLEKGALEELNPYMEATGIREEDYFPFVFSTWRQGESVYGISYKICVWGKQIKEEVLGSREAPDIEALTDALLAWEGDDYYQAGYDSGEVLKTFLEGTESLWGMMDWERGSCDFDTPLFARLLAAAEKYGDDGRKNKESGIMEDMNFYGMISFEGSAEQESAGKVKCGVLFDDGCHPASYRYYTLGVNANSTNKQAAWEFISYLITAEAQSRDFSMGIPPVQREAFETWLQEEIERFSEISYENGVQTRRGLNGADISEEKQDEYRNALEDARPLPLKTAPILKIILEEAEDYFNGTKNAEEVSRVVNNRVQLFLDEGKK